jgi:hypothetical protein
MKKTKNKRSVRRQAVRNGPRLDRLKSRARATGARVRQRVTTVDRPSIASALGSLAAGAGGAAIGGLLVNQEMASPEVVGGIMALGGAAVAYLADGNTRTIFNSVASAGAGQLALALMGRKAIGPPPPAPVIATAARPALPAPSTPPGSRKSASGGAVVELFRDAAMDLDMIDEDEIRYGVRDAEFGEYDDAYDYAA